jgi:hypothetical protein
MRQCWRDVTTAVLEVVMRRRNLVGGLLAALCALGAPLFAGDAPPKPQGKWLVIFDHWSESDGELVLRIAPAQGEPVEITTRIPNNTRENVAAELLAGSLKGQLGGGYKVEIEDGEKVMIKAKGKTPKFVLSVANSTVAGLQVKLRH